MAPAFANMDSSSGRMHMFEFNADSVLGGLFSFDKSKSRGSNSDDDIEMDLRLNYAYQVSNMPRLQFGGRLNYLKDTGSLGDVENWGFQVGAILNNSENLRNSIYASLYLGMDWSHEYGGAYNVSDEVFVSTFAIGRRYAMEEWGVKHLTYTPEIAFQNLNSTTGGDLEFAQSIQFRFLQFSVFF